MQGSNGWSWTHSTSVAASRTAAERWAALVLRACDADRDPATIGAWASAAGSCETTIHATCRMLRLSARDSRDFARLLRALRNSAGSLRHIEGELRVMEARTWKGLLERSGLAGRLGEPAITFERIPQGSTLRAVRSIAFVWHLVSSPDATGEEEVRTAVEDVESEGRTIALSSAIRKGPSSAELVLLEFSDYQCPYCGKHANETFARIDQAFVAANRIQYAFHNLPLPGHPDAIPAAVAAECAGDQGKYWEMHDRLFARQADLSKQVWLQEAPELQLDVKAFEACLASDKAEKVKGDLAAATGFGVDSTPTFIIGRVTKDGQLKALRRISGAQPFAVFEKELNELLGKG